MEPLTQRVPACPVWTNSFANKCPSPADKIFSWFVAGAYQCSHKKLPSFSLWRGAEGEGGFVEGQIQTSSLPYSRHQTIFSILSPFNLSEIKILGIVA